MQLHALKNDFKGYAISKCLKALFENLTLKAKPKTVEKG